jgi:hypothetical protein
MEDLLHETIHKIKNLKIEGILNESGMPTDQHADALKEDIETCITEFETETNTLLVDDPDSPAAGFIFDNMAKLLAFADTGAAGVTESCLDVVRATFYDVFDEDEALTGESYDIVAVYDDCKAELDAFKLDAEEVIAAKCLNYTLDADKQHHKAKADFLRLIESSMKKLVGLSGLTPEEVIDLKTLIVAKRVDFGTAVEAWATDLSDALDAIKS